MQGEQLRRNSYLRLQIGGETKVSRTPDRNGLVYEREKPEKINFVASMLPYPLGLRASENIRKHESNTCQPRIEACHQHCTCLIRTGSMALAPLHQAEHRLSNKGQTC